MKRISTTGPSVLLAAVLGWLVSWAGTWSAVAGPSDGSTNEIRIVEKQGTVEIATGPLAPWILTQTNQVLHPGYRLRTGPDSRVAILWSDLSILRFSAQTEIEILPPHASGAESGLNFLKGLLSFFHRDEPGRIRLITRGTLAGVKGTEFVAKVEKVNDVEQVTYSVIDGEVECSNAQGKRILTNGQQTTITEGQAPGVPVGFNAKNILQWCFYYPAVLDLRDLPLTPEEQQALGESLAAYRAGDLLTALAKYPAGRPPGSDAERLYHAALLLSVGQVQQSETALAALSAAGPTGRLPRLAKALRQLIAAVKNETGPSTLNPESRRSQTQADQLSTEFLAASYYEQSRAVGEESLKAALVLALQAATNSPAFGFAWERVAELEFSFGRTGRALDALNKSLALAPRNAQAIALVGFLLAAQNKINEAIERFDEAIAMTSAPGDTVYSGLGNAWLGRGLCRIRRGDMNGGREDLLVAAALEPQRAQLRSYLGKAYGKSGDTKRARHELDLAKNLDPDDPTAWLYSALLNQENHRLNEGIRDLEKSEELNENRRIYRSQFLLDQDRAVRGSSLAAIYRDNAMTEVSVREAAQAVSSDYANYSAHLFLANSYDALRDPTRFNLRYETAWFNELLLANLLAPVGAGTFAQSISQQEYSRLFETKQFGLTTTTDFRSDGQYREVTSQFGSFGNFGYSLDLDYQHNDDVGARGRPNNELDRIEWYSQLKFQLTPADTLFLLTKYQDYHSGDNFQYFDWRGSVRTNFTFDETQSPIVVAGFHHEWSPGAHTLLLGGRLQNDQRFSDLAVPELVLLQGSNSNVSSVFQIPFDVKYRSELEAYTAELAQIFQGGRQTLFFGGRLQGGEFDTRNELDAKGQFAFLFPSPAAATNSRDDFRRATAYAYYTLEPLNDLFVTAGLAYDHVEYPENFRHPPISAGETTKDLLGPKAGLVYSPADWITLRGIYTRSLGGVSLDQSYRLEPTQIAGFVQTFRSIIPESVVGSVSAPTFETYGAALDLKFKTGTYVGIQAQKLSSDVNQELGVFEFYYQNPPIRPASTRERLDFEDRSIGITVNQLLADQWSAGVSYKFTSSRLAVQLPDIPISALTNANNTTQSDLHQVGAYLLFNHPSGFFARAEANWYAQANSLQTHDANSAPVEIDLPHDEFPQFNLYLGWRFPRQRGDVTFGVLNLGGGDYHLNPLNAYAELPHERVYAVQLRLRF